MDILKLTKSGAVRTVLGATADDIPDAYFTDSDMEVELKLHIAQWLTNYATIITEGVTTGATTAQKVAYEHLQMYGKYYCADLASKSVNFLMAQMESDGENEFQRFQENKLEALIDSIHRKMASHRAYLVSYSKTAFSTSDETVSYSQFGKATPSSDPVTGTTT